MEIIEQTQQQHYDNLFILKHMSNTTKTILLVILLLVIASILTWCSWDYDEQTKLQIQELEKQAGIAQVACDNLQVVNNKIKSLKGYLGSESTSTPPQEWISNDSKPLLRTKTNAACMVWDTINIEEWFAEDYTYESDCWAFSDYGVQGCNINYSGEYCLLNESLDELNKLLKL